MGFFAFVIIGIIVVALLVWVGYYASRKPKNRL